MAINKIITEKTLDYIETLYTYANLQDFIKVTFTESDTDVISSLIKKASQNALNDFDGFSAYNHMNQYFHDTVLCHHELLGFSNGRHWYDLGYCRLGIMAYDLAKVSNQFNVEIQYSQSHMFSLGAKLEGLKLPFGGSFENYHIKRIDITQIAKTPYDYLTNHAFISPYRSVARFGNDARTETVYLGNRSNGNVFRMYNKTIELNADTKQHPIDYKKIELFSKYFGDIENLYTFELELHRKYFKSNFGIDTLSDLDKVYNAYREIVGKIKIYEDTDFNKKLVAQKHHSRIKDTLCFTEYKEFARIQKKKYKPSENYLIEKIAKTVNNYEKSLSKKLNEHERILLVDKIVTAMFDTKEVSIELIDNESTVEHKEMIDKIEFLRINQDDQLFKESNRAFSPMMLQTADEVF